MLPFGGAFRLLLEASGFEVVAFASGEAFLASGELGAWDCIVTDLCMPGLTGCGLLQRLHAQGKASPVIVVTASGDSAHRERNRSLGVVPLVQDAFWVSMAPVMMFGFLFGTVLTVVLVPTLYATLYRIASLKVSAFI